MKVVIICGRQRAEVGDDNHQYGNAAHSIKNREVTELGSLRLSFVKAHL